MMKKLIFPLTLTFLISILLPALSFSQNDQENGKSSLHHMLQGSISFTQLSGNVDAHDLAGSINGAYWGSTFSNLIFIRADVKSVETDGNKATYKMYDILNLLRRDIAGNLFGVGAFDFEKNEPILIESRYSGFLGAGYDLILKPGHNLSVIAAIGRTSETNTVPVDNPYGDFTSIFLMNSYGVQITENFSLDQQFDFFAPIDELERSRIRLSLSANTTIYKNFGVAYRFDLKYYKDPLVSLSTLQKNESLDLTQTIALTFQL